MNFAVSYALAFAAAALVLGIAVTTMPGASARERPTETVIWSPQGWPVSLGGR